MPPTEEDGLQTDENTGQETDSQTEGTPVKTETEEKIDWEKRYKDLQTDHTRAAQEAADLRTRVEQLEQPAEEPNEFDTDEDDFVPRKTVKTMITTAVKDAVHEVKQQSADSYFRRAYPDYVDDEDAIGGILRSPKHRRELLKCNSSEDRVDFAVKKFQERLEKASADAKTQAETEAKERQEKNRKATGLGDSSTTPSKSDDEDVSDEQEIKNRKSSSAKKRGLS